MSAAGERRPAACRRHRLARSGNACKAAPRLERAGAGVPGPRLAVAGAPRCGALCREDELGIHWRDAQPATAAGRARRRGQPRWRPAYDLMPGHPPPP